MKKTIALCSLCGGLLVYGADVSTNSTPALIPAPVVHDSDAAAMFNAMQQWRDVEQRKAAAVAAIPGMKDLDAQIAEQTARLVALHSARRALLASNVTITATFERERAQLRVTLQRREMAQAAARLAQSKAQQPGLPATNLPAATDNVVK
jgi:hypothetical protein